MYSFVCGLFQSTCFMGVNHIALYSSTFSFSLLPTILLNEYIDLLNIWIVSSSSAAMNILVHVFRWTYLHISVECISKNWIAESQDTHMFSFSKFQFTLPPTVYESFNCSSGILASTPYFIFQFSHSGWYWILVLFCTTLMSNGVNLISFSCVW